MAKQVRFDPRAARFAVRGRRGDLVPYHATTGAIEHVLREHTASVPSVALSPDGPRLVSGGRGGHLIVCLGFAQFEFVSEAGTAPAVDRQAKHGGLALLAGDEGYAFGGAGREGNHVHDHEIGSRRESDKLSASGC